MKLLFKQRFFSWFDSYDIFTEFGQTAYTVKGQLAWGHCLKIFDSYGEELHELIRGDVRQYFDFLKRSSCPTTINKKISALKQQYNVGYKLKNLPDYVKEEVIKRCGTEKY